VSCKGGCHSGNPSAICCSVKAELLKELEGWEMIGGVLDKEYVFKDFVQSIEFVNKIAGVAEEMFHHPNILLAWGKVKVTIWTHAVNDLTELDFTLAKEIDCIK
tara:strand:+ start:165 stop:476 length:312 start_codon:yes stop_codon:yes gene_type:complete